MVARGTARTAVQRLAYAIEQSFQSRVVTARVTEAIPALPSRWLETLLSSSQELEPAHRLGILKVEETA